MDLRGKRLLILGGSRISCEIIKHANAMGIITGVTDWYPLELSPAKKVADEAYYVSTSDIDAMEKLVSENNFDGIITGFTDSVLPYYAEICNRVGMPSYGTKKQFEIFTDKKKFKELLREYDVPTILEYNVDINHFTGTSSEIVFPVIVKPSDRSGSQGITVCNNIDELKRALTIALENSKSKKILVEQYLDNEEATAFWLFIDGRYYLILMGNRIVKHNQDIELPLPVGYTYPASIQNKFIAEIVPKMERMFQSIGIKNGMMFMQCKVIDGNCMVHDIGYRLTGSLEYINLKALCGFDPLDMLIEFALTGKMGDSDIENKIDPYLRGKHAYNVSLLCKPGKIANIYGIEKIKKIRGVLDVVVAHPEGDTITQEMKGRLAQIAIRVLGYADSIDEMKKEMLEIQRIAHIISDTGEEMLLPGVDKNDFIRIAYER